MMKLNTNKIQTAIIICFFIVIIVLFMFLYPLEISDELWNFQNICKMCNGLTIYKDANVIITPLFFYIGFILFKIFGATILTFRFYNTVICLLTYYLTYKILKDLKISKNLCIIFLALIFEFGFQLLGVGANYNRLAIIFILIGLDFYINKKSNNIKQGIMIFLIFFTKQNFGVLYAIAIILYELYKDKFSKKFIANQFKKFFVFIIPTGLILLQMYLKGNLLYFVNYAFGGLLDFGEKNVAILNFEYYALMPIVALIIYVLVLVKKSLFDKHINKEQFDMLTLLFIFSTVMTFAIIPIMNTGHFLLIMPFNLFMLFYFFDIVLLDELFKDEKYNKKVNWIAIVILLILLIRLLSSIFFLDDDEFIKDKKSHFYGIFVENHIVDKSREFQKYILEQNEKGIEVVILTAESAYTMTELKQNHGEYDLLFNGNMGYDGVKRIEKDILSRENTEFLVLTNEEDMFWQESKEIREFIIKNLKPKGEILNYTIYTVK